MYLLERLREYYEVNCPPFENDFLGNVFVFFSYAPAFVSVFLFGVSFWRKEMYMLLLGVITVIDAYGINRGLQAAFNSPSPFPGCGGDQGMPATASESAYVLYALFFTFPLYYRRQLTLYHALLAATIVGLLQAAEMQLGLATPQQALVGAFVGAIVGFLWQWIIHVLIYPFFRGHRKIRVCFHGKELVRYWNWLCKEYPDEKRVREEEELRIHSLAFPPIDDPEHPTLTAKERKQTIVHSSSQPNIEVTTLNIFLKFAGIEIQGIPRGRDERGWKVVQKPKFLISIEKKAKQHLRKRNSNRRYSRSRSRYHRLSL